jgi:predicted 2-oxoglutarate/Fe(II)-dependent dioxygenase YbiX
MPSARFFEHLGLFVRGGFLDRATCADLRAILAPAPWTQGTVARESEVSSLDETVRKVRCVDVDRENWTRVRDHLWALRPELEHHFGRRLTHCHGPDFLIYDPGAFYRPHLDSGTHYQTRRVSVVIFLNGERDSQGFGGFTGGGLTFHGLLDGSRWEKCPIPLSAEPGLLVAFPSETLHEVRPVMSGQRYTIVGWFTDQVP